MKISLRQLRKQALKHGLKIHKNEFGVYQLIQTGGFGSEFNGSFDQVRCWLLGYEFHKQHIEHNYTILSKQPILGSMHQGRG